MNGMRQFLTVSSHCANSLIGVEERRLSAANPSQSAEKVATSTTAATESATSAAAAHRGGYLKGWRQGVIRYCVSSLSLKKVGTESGSGGARVRDTWRSGEGVELLPVSWKSPPKFRVDGEVARKPALKLFGSWNRTMESAMPKIVGQLRSISDDFVSSDNASV